MLSKRFVLKIQITWHRHVLLGATVLMQRSIQFLFQVRRVHWSIVTHIRRHTLWWT